MYAANWELAKGCYVTLSDLYGPGIKPVPVSDAPTL